MKTNSIHVMLILACSSQLAHGLDESMEQKSPSQVALQFVTAFINNDVDTVTSLCRDEATRQRTLPGSTAKAHLAQTLSRFDSEIHLRLKHLHVFAKPNVTEAFLKRIMPTVQEEDILSSFKPLLDVMGDDGFCCMVEFDVVKGGRDRPYMFLFIFTPEGENFMLATMDEGIPR